MSDDEDDHAFNNPLLNNIHNGIINISEEDYYNDEGIPLVNQIPLNNNMGARVILDLDNDDKDSIVYLNSNKEENKEKKEKKEKSIKDKCNKGCCNGTNGEIKKQESLEEEKLIKRDNDQVDSDNDEGIPTELKYNIGSKVILDLDQEDIIYSNSLYQKTSSSTPISTSTSTPNSPSLIKKECNKGCCGPKIDKIEDNEPKQKEPFNFVPTIDSKCKKGCCDSKIERKLETEKPNSNIKKECSKGCCGTKNTKEIEEQELIIEIDTIKKQEENNGCKKGCCPTSTSNIVAPIKKTFCCEICVDGHCCKSNCCEQVCCLTYSLKVPNFLNNQLNLNSEKKPKKLFATIFSKTCGSFGFKVGYSELDENNNTIRDSTAENEVDNSSISIELLESNKKELFLIIGGMTCADCCSTLEQKVKSLPGIIEVTTSLFTGKCKILYSPSYIEPLEIIKSIVSIGFQANQDSGPNSNEINISFDSITTNRISLFNLIDKLLIDYRSFINDIKINQLNNDNIDDKEYQECLTIIYNIDEIGPRKLFNLISSKLKEECGTSIVTLISDSKVIKSSDSNNSGSNSNLKQLFLICLLFFIPTVFIAFIGPSFHSINKILSFEFFETFTISTLLLWVMSTPVQFYCGKPLYISAWKTLVYAKKCSMDLLVMSSSSIAYFYSMINVIINLNSPKYNGPIFFETSVILLTLIILGRYLESLAKNKASSTLFEKVSEIDSQSAILLDVNEDEQIIDKQLIEKGDILKVLPYSKIPTDGIIVKGNGFIDESSITGEFQKVFKGENNTVYGGSINQKNLIHIKASKNSNDTTLANIVKLIQESQASKPPFQNIADRIASYFVPSILIFSVSMFIVWFCLAYFGVVVPDDNQTSFTFAIKIAMATMVISCPCAVSLATPTSIMVGSGVAAKHGILFKGGDVIESTNKINTIVFDKTGTLTTGKIEINHFNVYEKSMTPKEFFFYCGSTELASEHHIGKAIKQYSINQLSCNLCEPESSEIYPGKGIQALVEGKLILMGNKSFIQDNNIEIFEQALNDYSKFESLSNTVIFVSINGKLIGLISLQDKIKPEAKIVISKLKELNINCWMISGDNQKSVQSIAKQVGIDLPNCIHSALPIDKFNFISNLQNQIPTSSSSSSLSTSLSSNKNIVAFIGDGVNDSLALTQADVGISISSGTDIAIESAQIILMKNNLLDILVAIDLSKSIFSTIKFNLFWAFLYNLIGIPLSAGLLYPFFKFVIPPAISGISELFSSLPVVLFSLSLNNYKFKQNESISNLLNNENKKRKKRRSLNY